ncbi:hypothetical protein SPV_2549 [Streptococcus pneumoniae]|nr:hypothetical protein SPV_2549 [Streptococcus pneumoniae]
MNFNLPIYLFKYCFNILNKF